MQRIPSSRYIVRMAVSLLMSTLLAGCADMVSTADPGPDAARVRFRLAEPGDVSVREAVPTPCFFGTDPTLGRVVQVSYNTRAIRWIVESGLSRLGMPGAERYPSISYSEARVRAGVPIALRFMMMEGVGALDMVPRYVQWSMILEPGKDYEILVGKALRSIAISQIVSDADGNRLVPVANVMRTPYCPA